MFFQILYNDKIHTYKVYLDSVNSSFDSAEIIKCKFIKYILDENRNNFNEIVDIDSMHYEIFDAIYNNTYRQFLIKKIRKFNHRDKNLVYEIENIHNSLCYLGYDEGLDLFYQFICIKMIQIEKKKIEKILKMYMPYFTKKCRKISGNTVMSEDFFKKHLHNISVDILSHNDNVSAKFFLKNKLAKRLNFYWEGLMYKSDFDYKQFIKYIDKFGQYDIFSQPKELLELYVSHIERSDDYISRSYELKNPIKRLDWQYICENGKNLEDFYERYLHKVDWTGLCYNKNISCDFFIKYIEKVDWAALSAVAKLSDEFIIENLNKLNIKYLLSNRNISEKSILYIVNMRGNTKHDWLTIISNPVISGETILSNIHYIDLQAAMEEYHIGMFYRELGEEFYASLLQFGPVHWYILSMHSNLSDEFFEKRLHMLPDQIWDSLSRDRGEAFLERHIDKVSWHYACNNQNLSEEFFIRHIDKVKHIKTIWDHQNCTEKFFDLLLLEGQIPDYKSLFHNNNVSVYFFMKHVDARFWNDVSGNNFEKYIHRKLRGKKIFSFDKQWKQHLEKSHNSKLE